MVVAAEGAIVLEMLLCTGPVGIFIESYSLKELNVDRGVAEGYRDRHWKSAKDDIEDRAFCLRLPRHPSREVKDTAAVRR